MDVPVIETERLVLRGHRLGDFDAAAAMWAEPEVTRFIGGKPSTREESWARYIRYPGHWALVGYGYWMLLEKASGRYVGEAGFGDFKREITPPIDLPEQGWALAPWAQGRGYATEAVMAGLAWAEHNIRAPGYMCMISPENTPSIRVAEKAGYRESVRTTFKDAPTILFRR